MSLFENTHILAEIFSSETNIVIFNLCLQTAKRVYKNQITVYEYVNILFNQVYEYVIFLKIKYMIGVGSRNRTKITPKLPPPPSANRKPGLNSYT